MAPLFFSVDRLMRASRRWPRSRGLLLLLALGCATLASPATAGGNLPAHAGLYPAIPWSNNNQPCWDQAAAYHRVDPWLLYAIASVESSYNPAAVNRANNNGSVDTGLMQVNSIHWPALRRYGIDPSALYNACASTYIGAWVLAQTQRRYGNSWEAIAAYNTGSVEDPRRRAIGLRYARKVYAAYDRVSSRYRRVASTATVGSR